MRDTTGNEKEKQNKATIEFNAFLQLALEGVGYYQYGLGLMYERGLGTAVNEREALKWFEKAAERGVSSAPFTLAASYYEKREQPENIVLSYFWYKIHGILFEPAYIQSGLATIKHIDDLEKLMTSQQKEEGDRKVNEWIGKYKKRMEELELPEKLRGLTGFLPIPD